EVDATGAQILAEIATALAHDGQRLGLALTRKGEGTVRIFESGVIELIGADALFDDVDRAIEWAEDDLLVALNDTAVEGDISLREIEFLRTLSDDELNVVAAQVRRAVYAPGREIFHRGDPGDGLFIM